MDSGKITRESPTQSHRDSTEKHNDLVLYDELQTSVRASIVRLAIEKITSRESIVEGSEVCKVIDCEGETFTVNYSIHTLRRYFNIDDHATSISLPFSREVIIAALLGIEEDGVDIKSCIDCIRHLNPLSAAYYLRYNIDELSIAQLESIYSRLQQGELDYLSNIPYQYTIPIVPGVAMKELIPYLLRRGYLSLLASILRDHPSIMFKVYCDGAMIDEARALLLSTTFNDDSGSLDRLETIRILQYLVRVMDKSNNQEKKKVLAMCAHAAGICGTHCEPLHSQQVKLLLPYQITFKDGIFAPLVSVLLDKLHEWSM